MQIQLLFFASAREKIGHARVSFDVPVGTQVDAFKKLLVEKHPVLEPMMGTILIAVNQQFAGDDEIIPDDAEVAIFPPVSGGSGGVTLCQIVTEPIDIAHITQLLTCETTGAVVVFTGVVRGRTEGKETLQTVGLEYQAYLPMAESKLAQIANEIHERWTDVEGIALIQRIGYQAAGEVSVVVACAASHRDTGVFEAARYGIDRLKEIVPVWKKEIRADGSDWIEGTYHPGSGE
jgi:molybdopterin synthase catalytic subunit